MHVRQFDEISEKDTKQSSRPYLLGGGIHPYLEVFYLSNGHAMLEWIGSTYIVEAPAILLVWPNTPHRFFRCSADFRCWYIELDNSLFEHLFSLEMVDVRNEIQVHRDRRHALFPLIDVTLQNLYDALKKGWHTSTSQALREIVILDLRKLFVLMSEVISQEQVLHRADIAQKQSQMSASQEPIYQLIRYIEAEYASNITLTMLAQRSGFTSSYISRLFKERIGLAPMQYVQLLRLHAALSYLQSTQMNIQDIAERCGFLSLHYFSRLFKQKYGVSPSQWRKMQELKAGNQIVMRSTRAGNISAAGWLDA